jgi:TusA-related sulfurtransferase
MMKSIDVTKDHCPMTFVKVKVALADLKVGERLDVLLTPGEPLENVPKSAEGEGNRIIEIREDGDNYHVVIEKHGFLNAGCGGGCKMQDKPT